MISKGTILLFLVVAGFVVMFHQAEAYTSRIDGDEAEDFNLRDQDDLTQDQGEAVVESPMKRGNRRGLQNEQS